MRRPSRIQLLIYDLADIVSRWHPWQGRQIRLDVWDFGQIIAYENLSSDKYRLPSTSEPITFNIQNGELHNKHWLYDEVQQVRRLAIELVVKTIPRDEQRWITLLAFGHYGTVDIMQKEDAIATELLHYYREQSTELAKQRGREDFDHMMREPVIGWDEQW